ncbi:MAG: U32 family peptidase [Clostridiales bacterium]|nr:U32 family peptidase [Clostridiales bacterium]
MKHELLAPAGSYDTCRAVLAAGADAVYLGGARYGARAFAQNFSESEILAALDLAHLHGKKIFLTVNTLLKNRETGAELFRWLKPYYEHGLDAIIVQDYGVFQFVRERFPRLPVHASTQMSVANVYGASFLKKQGISRVITARELSLSEIRRIHEEAAVEIESFVHGALCYCYSGQCLMSSLIGGRSGNRGRCAQPCRLPYQVRDEAGRVYRGKERFPLSPKDLCALDLIPQLCEAGVYSFKIEGRMKSPEYAAGVTQIYRKYLDMYEAAPERFEVEDTDRKALLALGSRSGFTRGYYDMRNGREMMALTDSSHSSGAAQDVYRTAEPDRIPAEGRIILRVGEPMCLTLWGERKEPGRPARGEPAEMISALEASGAGKSAEEKSGSAVCRRQEPEAGKSAEEKSGSAVCRRQETEAGKSAAEKSGSAVCRRQETEWKIKKITVTVTGEIVASAEKRPLTREDVRGRLSKTGDTPFALSGLEIVMDDGCFVPVKQLNELRRKAFCQLEQSMLHSYRRTLPVAEDALPERGMVAEDAFPEGETVAEDAFPGRGTVAEDAFPGRGTVAEDASPGRGTVAEDASPEGETVAEDVFPARGTVAEKMFSERENIESARLRVAGEDGTAGKKMSCGCGADREKQGVLNVLNVQVSDEKQLSEVLRYPFVSMVSLDFHNCGAQTSGDDAQMYASHFAVAERALRRIRSAGKQAAYCFPYVFRENTSLYYENDEWKEILRGFDTVWVRSYDSLEFCMEELRLRPEQISLDYGLYIYSETAYHAFAALGFGKYTASPELNQGELAHMPNEKAEFCLYGDTPMMVSAQCVYKNYLHCMKGKPSGTKLYLSDRYEKIFPVHRNCKDCYNVIYNSRPLYLLHQAGQIKKLAFGSCRIAFVSEDAGTVHRILRDYERSFLRGEDLQAPSRKEGFTNGHFRRGVE